MAADRSLSTHGRAILGLLILQYLLGMAVNLFVKFPENAREGQLWVFAWTQIPLALHIINAILLFIASLALVIRAFRRPDSSSWRWPAAIGFLAILLAFGAGVNFIPTQQDSSSYIMAVGFIAAFIAYGWGLGKTK